MNLLSTHAAVIKSPKRWCAFSIILVLMRLLIASHPVSGQKAVPELWGLHVHDEAHILTQTTVDKLEKQLIAYQDSSSNEIAILIISSLEGESLESYSLEVVEKWQLGKKAKDNGVLLLIVVDEHKMRIETGYGLEGVLTDAICSRIIRNEIAPYFRQNKYDEGVSSGINTIIQAIGNEYAADEAVSETPLTGKERILIGVFIFGILAVFTFLALFIPGCAGWFLYAFLIPFYATFPLVVLGTSVGVVFLIIYIVCFPILKLILVRTPWGTRVAKKFATINTSSRGRGWSSGSGWSAGSGGGRSSGGFSGGGGSFGGGGSSGSW
jgi:uncharacterized protein